MAKARELRGREAQRHAAANQRVINAAPRDWPTTDKMRACILLLIGIEATEGILECTEMSARTLLRCDAKRAAVRCVITLDASNGK